MQGAAEGLLDLFLSGEMGKMLLLQPAGYNQLVTTAVTSKNVICSANVCTRSSFIHLTPQCHAVKRIASIVTPQRVMSDKVGGGRSVLN